MKIILRGNAGDSVCSNGNVDSFQRFKRLRQKPPSHTPPKTYRSIKTLSIRGAPLPWPNPLLTDIPPLYPKSASPRPLRFCSARGLSYTALIALLHRHVPVSDEIAATSSTPSPIHTIVRALTSYIRNLEIELCCGATFSLRFAPALSLLNTTCLPHRLASRADKA